MATGRLIEMLLDSMFPPTSREGVKIAAVQHLRELQALKGTELTEEEYSGARRAVLDDLVSYPHNARIMFIASLACSYIPVGVLIAAAVYGSWQWLLAGVGTLFLGG